MSLEDSSQRCGDAAFVIRELHGIGPRKSFEACAAVVATWHIDTWWSGPLLCMACTSPSFL